MHVDYDSDGYIGFTDVVSNAVLLDDISPLSRNRDLVEGSLDLKYLPAFVHEAAHHACYDSPVGLALASLFQSTLSLFWEQVGTKIPQQPVRDLAVGEAAKTLLQPLLEGLALFCEHDLYTGDSPVISRVTERTSRIFTRGPMQVLLRESGLIGLDGINRDRFFSVGHSAVLRQARMSTEWVERKGHLLGQSLNGPERYLLGYLAVKGIYASLITRCPDLADPEVFFLIVTRHFMHDSDLRSILLRFRKRSEDPAESYLHIGQDISDFGNRFQDLFDELFADTAALAKQAIDYTLRPVPAPEDACFGADELFLGMRTVGTFNIAWPRLMKHRREFRFSFQPVVIRLTRAGEAVLLDRLTLREILRTMSVEGCRPVRWEGDKEFEEFEGSVEAVQLLDLTTVVAILGHHGLIAVYDCESGLWNPSHVVEALDDMPSGIAIEGSMHAFAQWQTQTGDRDEVREMLAFYRRQSIDSVDLLYPQLACNGWKAPERERLMRAFAPNGVFSIYDSEEREAVAKLSLLAGLLAPVADVARNMQSRPDELKQLVTRLNGIATSACGFQPFMLNDAFIFSRV
ncbi:MAG: hypothetical protein AABP62_15705 [Planctomycetota bacterium]